jgi:Fe-S cluster assembly protein SufD
MSAMTAPLRLTRTAAETAFGQQFAEARAAGLGSPALDRLRRSAFDHFDRVGLPNRRVEAWHYTDLRQLMRQAAAPAPPPAAAAIASLIAQERPNRLERAEPRLFLFDGHFIAAASDLDLLAPGLSVRSLADALEGLDQAAAAEWLGIGDDPALALNLAFIGGGCVIDVAADAQIERPLHLISIVGDGADHAIYPRVVVRLGARASLNLVETLHAHRAGAHQRNQVLSVHLADAARLAHVARVVLDNPASLSLSSLLVRLGARADFSSFALVAAGGISRRQAFVRFEGTHGRAHLSGVSLLEGRQHADTTLLVEHAAGHCESREFFRHVLADEAVGVFQGKVLVEPGAQKTDGVMKSQALLLDEGAAMNNKPELEIFADDVVCGHGATVGQLDPDQLFYLMARGLPRAEAEALLLQAFAAEAIERVADPRLRADLEASAKAWFLRRRQ